MLEERDERLRRLRTAMAEAGLDGLLAYAPGWRRENVRYLTNAPARGSFSLAYLPAVGAPVAFLSSAQDSHAARAAGWVQDTRPLDIPDCNELVQGLRGNGVPEKLGVAHLELMPYGMLAALRSGLPGTTVVSASGLMTRVRLVKSAWEIEQIRKAGEICSAGWESFVRAIAVGAREHEIVAHVEYELKRSGAEDNFMLIASGRDEVRGMTPPGERILAPGDMVRTELTPQVNGYWAQICRSAVLGPPDEGQRRSFELFNEALQAGIEATHAGVTAADIARAVNNAFRKHGYGEYCTSQYTRVRGHGHGLHLDEAPAILEDDETVLPENAVVIIHPNTYTPLAGYHVLGDPVVVTRNGCQPLLRTERRLFAV